MEYSAWKLELIPQDEGYWWGVIGYHVKAKAWCIVSHGIEKDGITAAKRGILQMNKDSAAAR